MGILVRFADKFLLAMGTRVYGYYHHTLDVPAKSR